MPDPIRQRYTLNKLNLVLLFPQPTLVFLIKLRKKKP